MNQTSKSAYFAILIHPTPDIRMQQLDEWKKNHSSRGLLKIRSKNSKEKKKRINNFQKNFHLGKLCDMSFWVGFVGSVLTVKSVVLMLDRLDCYVITGKSVFFRIFHKILALDTFLLALYKTYFFWKGNFYIFFFLSLFVSIFPLWNYPLQTLFTRDSMGWAGSNSN
jgi:hypothetical protein